QHCLLACFLSQEEPKKISDALKDDSWVEAMQEELLQFKLQHIDGIFISQNKYVADMLKKFDLASVKTAITPMETKMALTKDEEADEVDVHLYRSMIGDSKNHMKTIKNGQTRTQERKSVQEQEAKVKKSKPSVNSSQPKSKSTL
ncbi:hypothetical protein Tco_0274144, partial [Tanacetum coccineum]